MKSSDFHFDLPAELIAQQPAARRSGSRMLVLHRESASQKAFWEHRHFHELPEYLRAHDLLVLNDTRVIPARVFGTKEATGGKVEFLFLEEEEPGLWDVLMRCSRRPLPGQRLLLDDGRIGLTLVADGEAGRARVCVEPAEGFLSFLERHGEAPLPPYIKRPDRAPANRAGDLQRYQTVYAEVPGAVAAPTAGLHFEPALFESLASMRVATTRLTLHVGIGTFRPVTAEQVEDHVMEAERYVVNEEAVRRVEEARQQGGRVLAVGSTSVRTLESVARDDRTIAAGAGRTNLFIYPPYDFKVVDAMITNFHLPESTLLMMVSAFAGRELVLAAYEEAKRENYRFYSYGDCMLIL